MVKFGNKLRELQVPEWKEHYIQYKMMKKRVRNYAQAAKADPASREQILKEFAELLDRQVEKSVLFLLEKQGQLANRLLRLGDEREGAQENADKMTELQEEYRDVGRNLLKLLHFMEMNATGLRKILKKFDKRVGYRLTDYYVATRSNHPYSQLQQVFRHVGIGALVGAIAHNLAELKTFRGSLIALYYDSPHTVTFEEPIIELIKSAEDRLTNSTSFLRFLGKQLIAVDELPPLPGEDIAEREYHGMSVFLNLANTFLYMVNTYIIVPTADKYALSLGAAPTLCGVIIGSMAVAQLVSSVYFSAWSNRSYFRPLIFSSIMLLLGNILYAVAYDFDSLTILILGRLLCGLGSARAVNRRYISDCVPVKYRLKASAAFVSASALGMACGPALAGVLEFDTTFLSLSLNANTLPGWVMAVAWVVYLGYLSVGFKEPPRNFPADPIAPVEDAEVADESGRRVSDLAEPLLKSSGIIKSSSMEDDFDEKDSYEGLDESSTGASFFEACRLLTKPVKVQLYIYFMLKFAMEILLSESSVVTAYYFHWGTGSVAVFLALLGLTVLPVNWVVGSYVSNMFEDRQILVFSQAFTCLGIVLSLCYCGPIPYTVGQYISGALLIFVSAEVLEGVNLSLLSRVMSSRLSRGTWNGGLLSTEAGTLARVVADVTITLAGYLGDERLLNVTLLPSLFFGVTSLFATFLTFNSLY